MAVYFLWHYPWLDDHEPVDVIHHRVLTCSDFPLPVQPTAITCPPDHYTFSRVYRRVFYYPVDLLTANLDWSIQFPHG